MPLYGDILQANFFDLNNSINRQVNGDLEPLKGFGINFFSLDFFTLTLAAIFVSASFLPKVLKVKERG